MPSGCGRCAATLISVTSAATDWSVRRPALKAACLWLLPGCLLSR
jgi:hypothetical protein